MKKSFLAICVLFAAGCSNPLTYDSAYASNKNWLEVVTDKKDWEGNQTDSYYKFHFKFLPPDAAARVNNNFNCINQCCWRSGTPEVILDFNAGFKQDLEENGTAKFYTPGKIKIKIKYSSVLGLITASVTPAGAIKRDGTIKLKYKEEVNPAVTARLAAMRAAKQDAADAQANIAAQRELQLKAQADAETKRLTYEADKNRSVDYIKRIYGRAIDEYLYNLDLAQRKKGYVLLNAEKEWKVIPLGNNFLVNCTSKSKLGKTQNTLKDYPIDCGAWLVDLNNASVKPYDALAAQIAAK
ncbi:MAG: hypothetical protein LBI01_05690 [Elusimicrobium sp.]|jgi:hypothetical protein|nr:hypothetical protein [Elusimicrobium sp.]